jgi:hypothetical protein
MAAPSPQPTTNQEKTTARSGARAPAQDAGPTGAPGTDMAVPSGRRRTPAPATPAAQKAKRPDLAVLTRGDHAGSKGSATGGEAAVVRKTSAATRKAKAPASPSKGSKAAIDGGSRPADVTRAGRTKAAKRTGTRTSKVHATYR